MADLETNTLPTSPTSPKEKVARIEKVEIVAPEGTSLYRLRSGKHRYRVKEGEVERVITALPGDPIPLSPRQAEIYASRITAV